MISNYSAGERQEVCPSRGLVSNWAAVDSFPLSGWLGTGAAADLTPAVTPPLDLRLYSASEGTAP